MKKLACILLVVLVVFGFVACDNDNPSPSEAIPATEGVMTAYIAVESDVMELFGDVSQEALDFLAANFDHDESAKSYSLKAGKTVTGPVSKYKYSYAVVKNGGMDADVRYTDSTGEHSLHYVLTGQSANITYDGTNYYVDSSMVPEGYPVN